MSIATESNKDQARIAFVSALVAFMNTMSAIVEWWPNDNLAEMDRLSERFPFARDLESEVYSFARWVNGVIRNFHLERDPRVGISVFGGNNVVQAIDKLASNALTLSMAWERLSSEDQNTVSVGYPFKASFDEVANMILEWKDSVH